MHWISLLLLGLTAGLFLYIMVLETFLTDSQLTARTFKMSVDDLRKPALNTVMKNLGVYNGLVGAGLLYALLFSPDGREVAAVFFAFGLVVAIYGAISSQFSILFKQGTLPFLGMVSLILGRVLAFPKKQRHRFGLSSFKAVPLFMEEKREPQGQANNWHQSQS